MSTMSQDGNAAAGASSRVMPGTLETLRAMNFLFSRVGEAVDKTSFTTMAGKIRDVLKSPESVSIFLRDDADPTRLILMGNVGYKDHIRVVYDVRTPSITGGVYQTLESANLSARDVEARGSLARCRFYLQGGHFFNVLAVPICISNKRGEAECFGVLKIENDGRDSSQPVHSEIEAQCTVIAHLLAMRSQLRWYADLWSQVEKGKHENGSEYLRRLPTVLGKLIRAEASFVYTRSVSPDGKDELRFQSGTVEMPNHELTPRSLLYAAGNTDLSLVLDFDTLASNERPTDSFLLELRRVVPDLRNLLVAPLVQKDQNCGVLVMTNREFGDFSPEDQAVAIRFGALVGGNLGGESQTATGLEELVRRFGSPSRLKGRRLISRVAEIQKLRDSSEIRITGNDCARYLQVSRPYFLKLAKEFRSVQSSD